MAVSQMRVPTVVAVAGGVILGWLSGESSADADSRQCRRPLMANRWWRPVR